MFDFQTACGGKIHISITAKSHLDAHPGVFEYLPEAINKIYLPRNGRKYEGEINLGREIGTSGLVKTPRVAITDLCLFAIRSGRKLPSRVVAGETNGGKTTKLTVIARKSRVEEKYELVSAWFGTLAKREPHDFGIRNPKDLEESLEFWRSHALQFDADIMEPAFESCWKQVLAESKFSVSGNIYA